MHNSIKLDPSILDVRRDAVARHLSENYSISPTWLPEPHTDGHVGECYCPHQGHHTNPRPNEGPTVRIWLDRCDWCDVDDRDITRPKVFLSCRHCTCGPLIWDDTLAIRKREESDYPGVIPPRAPSTPLQIIKAEEQRALLKKAAAAGEAYSTSILDSLPTGDDTAKGKRVKIYPTEDDIMAMSPLPVGRGKLHLYPYTQAILHLELFPPEALVWIGEVEDSRTPGKIRTAETWIETFKILERSPMVKEEVATWSWPGHYIAPCAFLEKDLGRNKANIERRLFAVAEADQLTRNEQLAVIKAMILDKRFPIAYVVSSGSKSYHIGLKTASVTATDEVYLAGITNSKKVSTGGRPPKRIGGMGFDPASLRPSQAVRLAGPPHQKTGNQQKLVYIDPSLAYIK